MIYRGEDGSMDLLIIVSQGDSDFNWSNLLIGQIPGVPLHKLWGWKLYLKVENKKKMKSVRRWKQVSYNI